MVGFGAQERKEYPSSATLFYSLSRGFNGYEDRIDLRQNVRIVKREHPTPIAHIVIVEDSQASNRFLGPQAFAPDVERDLCIYFSRVGKIVCKKDEGLPFCVENPAKGSLAPAVAISVVDIDNVEIARDYQFSHVACFRRELLLLA